MILLQVLTKDCFNLKFVSTFTAHEVEFLLILGNNFRLRFYLTGRFIRAFVKVKMTVQIIFVLC